MPYHLSKQIANRFLPESQSEKLLLQYSLVTDLFSNDLSKLRLFAQKKHIDFQKLVQLREFYFNVLLRFHSPITNIKANCVNIQVKCGSSSLDDFFEKLYTPNIIDIIGDPISGKTQLSISIALESALINTQVIFIDSDLSFPYRRCMQIIQNKYPTLSSCQIESALSLIKVYNLHKLQQVIDLLEFICENQHLHDSVLIIDSLYSILFATKLSSSCNNRKELQRQRMLIVEEFGEILKSVTHNAKLITFVTQLSTNELKNDFDNYSQMSIKLEKEPTSNFINVKMINKNQEQFNQNNETKIQINKQGIV